MGQTIEALVAGSTTQDIPIQGLIAKSVAITNPGSCWVHFPATAGAYAWIPPRYYGVIMPCPTPYGTLRVDMTSVPSAAYSADTSDLTAAQITIHEDALPFSPGQSLLTFLPPSTLAAASNVTQIAGVSLTGWALPWGTRWAAQTGVFGLAVGTYAIDIPMWVNPTYDTVSGSAVLTSGRGGVFSPSGRAVLYCLVGGIAGGGTATFTIQDSAAVQTGGAGTRIGVNLLASPALAANGNATLRVAPGLTPSANAIANDLVSLAPRIQVAVAVATQSFGFLLDLS